MIVPSPLVSVSWLNDHLQEDRVLIFNATIAKVADVSKEGLQDNKQIPNSVFFDMKCFSDQTSVYPNTILSSNEFQEKARALGVCNNSCIIVYDNLGIYSAPRVWWMFRYFGFENIAVLNGGLPAWLDANFETEPIIDKKIIPGDFIVQNYSNLLSYTKNVLNSIANTNQIIDARSSDRFLSLVEEPRKGVKKGRIPTSVNLPYTFLLTEGKFKSVKVLKQYFEEVNPENQKMIFSCGSGITACILALGASLSGYDNYAVYDGSWSEWGSREDLPVENLKLSPWLREEFEAYLLLFCAHSNFIETEEEREAILSCVDEKLYNRVHTEIVHDSYEISQNKIHLFIIENEYSEDEKLALIHEMKNVFFADGTVDQFEKKVFTIIKDLLFNS